MYAHDPKLLEAIIGFDIDGRDAALSFERRLARECNWSLAFAQRVVVEYRRFVYLAMTAGHPVTPSDEVDQAWHLHLVYTDSYWRRLCGQVLPRPLHHNPTAGGDDEDAKFNDWYERTRASYRAAFNQEPDPQVWPPRHERFDPKRQFRRVRSVEWLTLPKRTLRRAGVVAAALAAMPLLVGATMLGESSAVPFLLLFAIPYAVMMILVATAAARRNGRSRDGSSGGGCGGIFSGCGGGGGTLDGGGDSGGGHSGCGGSSGCSGGSGCGGGGGCGGGCGG